MTRMLAFTYLSSFKAIGVSTKFHVSLDKVARVVRGRPRRLLLDVEFRVLVHHGLGTKIERTMITKA